MTSTERDLIDAILADPDDDGPRLVYADWLEENGDDRAELIRLQIELANTPTTDERWWELDRRVEALLDRNTVRWTKKLPKYAKAAWGIEPRHAERRDGFVRGMMERATFHNPSQFEKNFDEMWRHTPVRHVRVNKWSAKGAKEFFRPEVMDRVRGLWLTWDGFDPACTRVPGFLELPHWERVETLRLFDRMLRPDGLEALLEKSLPALDRLEFVGIQPYDDVYVPGLLEAVAAWPSLAGVRDFTCERSAVDPAGAIAFAESPHVEGIERLSLAGNPIGAEALRALGESPHLQRVGDLSLAQLEPVDDELFALAPTPLLSRLRRFDLSWVELDGEIAQALVDGHRDWHELRLASTCNDEVAEVLAGAETLAALKSLDLRKAQLGEEPLVELVTSTNLESLQYVVVHTDEVSEATLDAIADRFPHRFDDPRGWIKHTEFATDPAFLP